ncbi:hypothetical protein AMTR_s05206p00001000 [Amborella trichopoda]|uniref:Uncharacterized protein n=1 Tax=Amborella trichopoda TaxID=13333 RepID=U5CL40_AMBTC|nr:hypothetical protein AMTR_s05206p00001000 [Amborella trichopoda]
MLARLGHACASRARLRGSRTLARLRHTVTLALCPNSPARAYARLGQADVTRPRQDTFSSPPLLSYKPGHALFTRPRQKHLLSLAFRANPGTHLLRDPRQNTFLP